MCQTFQSIDFLEPSAAGWIGSQSCIKLDFLIRIQFRAEEHDKILILFYTYAVGHLPHKQAQSEGLSKFFEGFIARWQRLSIPDESQTTR